MNNSLVDSKYVSSFNTKELTDIDVFEKDIDLLSSQWNFIDHTSNYNSLGDYRVLDILGESVIVVKSSDGFKAFFNFCSHRGSVICTKKQGNTKAFVCPYHSWKFGIDGKLLNAPACPSATAEPDKNALRKVEIREIEGMLFIGLNEAKLPSFEAVKSELEPLFSWQGLKKAKIAHSCEYYIEANWKLAVENFYECYHCFSNHPEMCSQFAHPHVSATDSLIGIRKFKSIFTEWCKKVKSYGHPIGGVEDIDVCAPQFNVIFRSVINEDTPSYAKNGKPLAPLMGRYKKYDNGETFGYSGPLTHFSMPTDHAFVFRINPISVSKTQLELFWLVEENAVEDKNYVISDLIWLWNTTIQQDIVAIERAAVGSKSKFYHPGFYTKLEHNSANFAIWYRKNILQI